LNALILVRLGQELGSDTPLARAVARLIEEALKLAVS
jgi:hypothetical protein